MATIKIRVYPDIENTITVEVGTTVVKEVLKILKDLLNLQGHYAVVKNGRILSDDEHLRDCDEIMLVPIVEGG